MTPVSALVLTNWELLTYITSFQAGVPQAVHEQWKIVVADRDLSPRVRWLLLVEMAMYECSFNRVVSLATFAIATRDLWVEDILRKTLMYGRVDILEWFDSTFPGFVTRDWHTHFKDAMRYEQCRVAVWFFERHHGEFQPDQSDLVSFAKWGDLDVLKSMLEKYQGSPNCTDLLNAAAYLGHAHIVEFLHRSGVWFYDSGALVLAAESGHLNVVQYLVENGIAMGKVNYSRFSFLQRPYSYPCWGNALDNAIVAAAGEGHLEIVRYLVELQPDQAYSEAMEKATVNERALVVEFLLQHAKTC